eukprot:6203395-Pleurochrysis_carterae.AAC.6
MLVRAVVAAVPPRSRTQPSMALLAVSSAERSVSACRPRLVPRRRRGTFRHPAELRNDRQWLDRPFK